MWSCSCVCMPLVMKVWLETQGSDLSVSRRDRSDVQVTSLFSHADHGDLCFQRWKCQVQIPLSTSSGAIRFERRALGTKSFLPFSAAFPYGPLTSALCYPSSTNFPELGPCSPVSLPTDKSARGAQPFQPKG